MKKLFKYFISSLNSSLQERDGKNLKPFLNIKNTIKNYENV